MRCGACHVEFDPVSADYITIIQYAIPDPLVDEQVCSWDCAATIVHREQTAENRGR